MTSKIRNPKSEVRKNVVSRIIDANTNRAVEGLRVMEEIVRFVLEEKKLTIELKEIRGALRKIINELIGKGAHFQQREALKDVGKELYTSKEAKRQTILDVFMANAKRVQEALRVLEEFSKLIKPNAGKKIKEIRFKVYDLEQKIFYILIRRLKLDFDLYVITDPMRNHVEVARSSIAGGVKAIQLRDKAASKKKFLKWARHIRKLTKKSGATFIVNDYLDVAKQVDADGVHLGQDDLKMGSISQARKRLGEDRIIGISTHSLNQAVSAARQGADYISVGPIFGTPSKPGIKPVGIGLLRRVKKKVRIPIVAIGGINQSNIHKIKKAGVGRVAVIRAVVIARNVKAAAARLRKILF